MFRRVYCLTACIFFTFASGSVSAQSANPLGEFKQTIARIARTLGAASSCKDISPGRISSVTDKVISVGLSLSTTREEFVEVTKLYDQNETEGRALLASGKVTCQGIAAELVELEQVINSVSRLANQSRQPSQPATQPQPAGSPGGSSTQGITDREIRLGAILPLSGTSKEAGNQLRMGLQTAVSAANDAGGVNGRQIRLFVADDGYDTARTPDALKQLYERDRVFAFVACYGSSQAMISVPFVNERRTLFFAPITGSTVVRQDPPDRYVFNFRASLAEEAEAAVYYLVKVRRLRLDQIAAFTQDDGYGDAGYAGVSKAARAISPGDVKPILRLKYKRNTIDVDEAVETLKKNRAIKAVVMIAIFRPAVRFIEKARDVIPDLIYTNSGGVGATSLATELQLLGARFMRDQIITSLVPSVDGSSSVVLKYKAALARYFPGEVADNLSFESYLSGLVLIEALKRAGPQLDTEKVVDALESMQNLDLGLGTPISFSSSDHQALKKVWGLQLKENGKYEAIELR
jgi:ABC-type branched-subunit amino acid transport system substrate-binding protein